MTKVEQTDTYMYPGWKPSFHFYILKTNWNSAMGCWLISVWNITRLQLYVVWILWSLIVVWGGGGGGGDKEDFVWCMKASISALQLLIIWWLNRTNFAIVNYCPVLTLSNCQNKTLMIIINNYKVNNFDEGKSQIWITLQVPQKGIFN